jgi:hypothetical protein
MKEWDDALTKISNAAGIPISGLNADWNCQVILNSNSSGVFDNEDGTAELLTYPEEGEPTNHGRIDLSSAADIQKAIDFLNQ